MDKDYRFYPKTELSDLSELIDSEFYYCSDGKNKSDVLGLIIKSNPEITHILLPKKPVKISQFSSYLATVDYRDKASIKPDGAISDKSTVHAFASYSDGTEVYFKLAEDDSIIAGSNLRIHHKIGAITYQLAQKNKQSTKPA